MNSAGEGNGGRITAEGFSVAARAFADKWKTHNESFPPWSWVPLINRIPLVSNKKEEGYLSLEKVLISLEESPEEESATVAVDCSENEEFVDQTIVVQNQENEAHYYDFHIVYSASYQVPVLYFRGYCSSGEPLSLDVIKKDLPSSSVNLLLESKWTFITHEEHPYLNRPWFKLHPCGTEEWVKLLSQKCTSFGVQFPLESYLVSWFSVVGQVVIAHNTRVGQKRESLTIMVNCMFPNFGFFLLLIFSIFYISFASVTCDATHQNDGVERLSAYEDVRIGLVVDMDSVEGKLVRSSISTALSDFYHVNNCYKTRVSVLLRDSHGDPLQALATASDLLQTEEVEVLIGGQSLLEAKILAELGEKAKVPVICFQVPSSSTLNKYSYFIQVAHDTSSEAKGITALLRSFHWRTVVLIYEDDDDWRESVQPLVGHFQTNAIYIKYKVVFSFSCDEKCMMKQLRKFKAPRIKIFVAHISERIATRLFPCARRLGMMEDGHAWILTARSLNNFHYTNYLANEAMEGVIGFKSYVPLTEELHNFTLRWRKSLLLEEEIMRMSIHSVWAHDIAWSLANAAETARRPNLPVHSVFDAIIENSKLTGLSGEIKFVDNKLISDKFEIVNVIGRGERRVGLWHNNKRRHLPSTKALETIIWPGGSSRIPKVRSLKEKRHGKKKKLRVLVPAGNLNPQILEVKTDSITGVTAVRGYCIEVFETAILPFNYEVEYIPWSGAVSYSLYNDLVYALYSEKDKYDAAVGDITITDNRSLYVDFTLPFTDMGLAVVAAKDKSMWIIFKPLTLSLWLTITTFFILTGAMVWLIERHDNPSFQGSCFHQIGTLLCFGFSTLVFAHREKLQHNLSRFVVIVWIFAVLILTSNYTATLTSVMTVQQIRLKSSENIGFFSESIAAHVVFDNPAFQGPSYKGLKTADDYTDALRNGTISFLVHEAPYCKLFVAKYPSELYIVKTESVTNGFGFVFQKGSPLVQNVSREIAKLRRTERLKAMEHRWFQSQTVSVKNEDTSDPLTVYKFRGLFMITGVSFAFALIIYLIPWSRDQRQAVLKHFHCYVGHRFARAIRPSPTTPSRQIENVVPGVSYQV